MRSFELVIVALDNEEVSVFDALIDGMIEDVFDDVTTPELRPDLFLRDVGEVIDAKAAAVACVWLGDI